jgi:hypothetical protein
MDANQKTKLRGIQGEANAPSGGEMRHRFVGPKFRIGKMILHESQKGRATVKPSLPHRGPIFAGTMAPIVPPSQSMVPVVSDDTGLVHQQKNYRGLDFPDWAGERPSRRLQ